MPSFIADIAGGGEAKKHAKNVRGYADQAWERSQPWDVESPLGGVTFDRDEKKISSTLSPEMQELFDKSISDIHAQREHISPYETDPDSAAEAYYQRWADITAPQREQQQLGLEQRQLAQGMLHSTGGNMREAALREAQLQDMRRARGAADTQVQAMIDTYRNRGQQALGNVGSIGTMGYPLVGQGQQQGVYLSGPAYNTAGMLSQASDIYRQGANRQMAGYIGAGTTALSLGAMAMGMMGDGDDG